MKIVVSNSNVAKAWANKTQPYARNPKNSFYFNGDIIYSYGSHFPIARHVKNNNGESAILFTTRDYSPTTAAHKREVNHAISSGMRDFVFNIENVTDEPSISDVKSLEDKAIKSLKSAKRARVYKDFHIKNAETLIEQANKLNDFFSIGAEIVNLDEYINAHKLDEFKRDVYKTSPNENYLKVQELIDKA
jgi:hypothetical protein